METTYLETTRKGASRNWPTEAALWHTLGGGGSPRILKTMYTGTVRPKFEYGASAWTTAAKTNTNKLDQVQNMGLRTILGAMKSTPIATIKETAGVEPLDYRRNANLFPHGEKVSIMPNHPLHKRLQDLTKNRLNRTSINHVLKEQQMKHSDILEPRPEEYEMLTLNPTPLVLKAEVKVSYQASAPSQTTVKPLLKH